MPDNLENNGGTPEGENPQNEGGNPTEQDVYTAEQRKRHLEQLEGSKKEAEKKEALLVETYKNLAENDANVLKDLHDKDPKIADKVAKEFGYENYRDIEKSNNTEAKNGLSEDDLEEWYQKRRAKDEHSEALKQADGIISKLPEEVREKAKQYFDDMSEGKTLTRAKATEFADMATLYVKKDNFTKDALNSNLIDGLSTGVGKSKSSSNDELSPESKDFIANFGGGRFKDLIK